MIGVAVPGTKGKTLQDQRNIDDNVARGCAANVYTRGECKLHTVASAERKAELKDAP